MATPTVDQTSWRYTLSSIKVQFSPADFFLFRTPLLEIDYSIDEFSRQREASSTSIAAEALYLSAHSLHDRFAASGAGDIVDGVRKYLKRMSSRCTPFGLAAGFAVGHVKGESRFEFDSSPQRIARLDLGVLQKIAVRLAGLALESGHPGLLIRANDSAWLTRSHARYVELDFGGRLPLYKLAKLRRSPAVDLVLERLNQGPIQLAELSALLSETFQSRPAEAAAFILNLVRANLLHAGPEISVTLEHPLEELIAFYQDTPLCGDLVDLLRKLRSLINEIGNEPRVNIGLYKECERLLAESGIEADASRILQIDMRRGGPTSLSRRLVQDIGRQLEAASSLLLHPSEEMAPFVQAFTKRYGDAEVPLLEALDEDFGIGFGDRGAPDQPLLGAMRLGSPPHPGHRLTKLDIELLKAVQTTVMRQRTSLDVQSIAQSISSATSSPPATAAVIGVLHASSEEDADRGDYQFEVRNFSGASAMSLFGRFTSGSTDLAHKVRDFSLSAEPDGDTIYAEIAHLPYGRVGNVNLRSAARPFELTYLSGSSQPASHRISAQELTVRVDGGRVVLFAPRLGKTIVPRLTSAHNFALPTNLSVYRFLGALQSQGAGRLGWSWRGALQELPFLPRITFGKLILARARWRLQRPPDLSPSSLEEALNALGAPNQVRLTQHDNFLELNLAEPGDRSLLEDALRRSEVVNLEEHLKSELSARDERGACYRHELVLPYRTQPTAVGAPVRSENQQRAGERGHVPGGAWLYAQIFAGPDTLDQIAAELVPQFQAAAAKLGCDRAFFVRYFEDGPHLRLRAHGDPSVVNGALRGLLEERLKPWVQSGAVHRIRYDTYQRETSRYGTPAVTELCESIFAADSAAAASGLGLLRGVASREDYRWRFAFISLKSLLADLPLSSAQQQDIAKMIASGFAEEFALGKAQNGALKAIYRDHASFFESDAPYADPLLSQLFSITQIRSARTRPILARVAQEAPAERLTSIFAGILHMTANRLFLENSRPHEMALWRFLQKALATQEARRRNETRAESSVHQTVLTPQRA